MGEFFVHLLCSTLNNKKTALFHLFTKHNVTDWIANEGWLSLIWSIVKAYRNFRHQDFEFHEVQTIKGPLRPFHVQHPVMRQTCNLFQLYLTKKKKKVLIATEGTQRTDKIVLFLWFGFLKDTVYCWEVEYAELFCYISLQFYWRY